MKLKTVLFSENRYKDSDLYIAKAIKNAEEGSEFEKKVRDMKDWSTERIIGQFNLLKEMGYNALLGYFGKEIFGHMAYQEHEKEEGLEWGLFHGYIIPEKRGNIYGPFLFNEFLKHAREKGVKKISFGEVNGLLNGLKRAEERLKIMTDLENRCIYLK